MPRLSCIKAKQTLRASLTGNGEVDGPGLEQEKVENGEGANVKETGAPLRSE